LVPLYLLLGKRRKKEGEEMKNLGLGHQRKEELFLGESPKDF